MQLAVGEFHDVADATVVEPNAILEHAQLFGGSEALQETLEQIDDDAIDADPNVQRFKISEVNA